MDLFMKRDAVLKLQAQLVEVWEKAFAALHNTVLGKGTGIIQWLGCWSNSIYTLPTCDFNALIGPADFEELCLPSLKAQAAKAGRCVFHLDGPEAARHAKTLAAADEITAIQYTPGAGTPSALTHIDMFKMFQKVGKSLVVICPYKEIPEVINKLDHRGLYLIASGVTNQSTADEILKVVNNL